MNLERLDRAGLICEFAAAVEGKNWPRMRMVHLRLKSRALVWSSRKKLMRTREIISVARKKHIPGKGVGA